jgi:pimeloyl-ACP methyl ester carboxylesterase
VVLNGPGPTDRLSTTSLGASGSLVVFCHGLFGQGKNWSGIGKAIADRHRVMLVDLPDHGRSPRTDRFDFVEIADRVAALLSPDDPVALVGHSMGGKVSMLVAVRHPHLVERLCVVDVAPVAYDNTQEFARYIKAMQDLDLDSLASRSDADAALREAVPDEMVRGFLLQSLRRHDEGWSWQLNLALLGRDLAEISGWPENRLEGLAPYDGPVLWVDGKRSGYVRPEHVAAMDHWFPRNRRVTVKDAGHWVHSEQPQVFVEVLERFLAQG